jgi:DNA-directed RNA polymerase subunit RPC12/RpoP
VIVRCGACQTQFDVPGPGRYGCPACGSVNMVRARPGAAGPVAGGPGGDPGMPADGGLATPPPPPPPEPPSPKMECPECGFSFIVGDVAIAVCPMCSAEVETGRAPAPTDEA